MNKISISHESYNYSILKLDNSTINKLSHAPYLSITECNKSYAVSHVENRKKLLEEQFKVEKIIGTFDIVSFQVTGNLLKLTGNKNFSSCWKSEAFTIFNHIRTLNWVQLYTKILQMK